MSLIITDERHYSDIASAIRNKLSTADTFKPSEMASAIMSITGGDVPTETITLSSNATYNVTNYATAIVDVPEPLYMQKYNDPNNLSTFIDSSISSISYGALAFTQGLLSVSFPEAVTIGAYAFAYCLKLESYSFPKLTTIGNYAFQYCSSLTALTSTTLPSLSGTVGSYAFRGCQNISVVDLPNITSVGVQAFSGCSRIKTVNLPNLTYVHSGAFSYCVLCTDYNLPKAKTIGIYAFYSNSSLATISLPACTTISSYIFRSCNKLRSLYLMGSSIPTLNANGLLYSPFSTSVGGVYASIYVPSTMYDSYIAATNWTKYKNRFVSVEVQTGE